MSVTAGPSDRNGGTGPPITVVIPCFNAAETIERAVTSALSQNDGEMSVIVVVDDGSAETLRILERLGDRRVEVLVNEANLGAPASRNRALARVASPYVSFLDADDFLAGDFSAPLLKAMKIGGAQVGFGPSSRHSRARGLFGRRLPDYRDAGDLFLRWMGGKGNVNSSSVMWSTDYLRKIGGWDETLRRNQDGELALRAILLGARFVLSTEGSGVWCDDLDRARITTRSDNLPALLDVADKFLEMRSDCVPDAIRTQGCAYYLYEVAHLAFSRRSDELGRTALKRSRALGFKGHLGSGAHILASSILGLPLKERLTRSARHWWRRSALGDSALMTKSS